MIRKALLFLFACLRLHGSSLQEPWLTGPLIAPVGVAVPYGNFLLKSYLSLQLQKGSSIPEWDWIPSQETLYGLSYQGFYFFGLTNWCDLNITPRVFYQTILDEHAVGFGDLTVGLDIQLLSDRATPYFPGIKFAVREVFPTGKYEFLRPRKLSSDLMGMGSFATQFDLVLYKLFHLYGQHWLSLTWSGEYTVMTPVSVHGFNAYGGGFGTKGTALPGNVWQTLLSFEVTLNRYVAFALDTVYRYTEATQFYGFSGISFAGGYAQVGGPSARQVNIAPALELNFSPHFGLIGGAYFPLYRENSRDFCTFLLNCNYFY